ncbi:MAG: PAS domain S-box protein, partial [Ferruginibacter sp.]|nr:PAS domain S-box protein [Ferruginibacter sp.]
HTDITEQKLAQEKLAYRTALLEAHNEASVDGLLLVDAKGKILSFNQRFVEIWNMPQHIVNDKDDEAVTSFAMSQLVNPQQFIDKVKYFYEHPTEISLDELELKNGKIVERNGYSVIGEDGTYYAWSWTFKDITERKIIEQDLKNTKDQLELTFKNIPAGVFLINEKGEMVYLNDRGAAIYGDFTPEYILKQKDLLSLLKLADELFERSDENGKYFSVQDSPAFISLTTGKPSKAILKQINKVNKEQRWYYVQSAPLFDKRGNVSLVLITSTDITEQKNAEEKIKYSEERFRSLAETLPQMVWVINGDGEMEYASKSWEKYSGIGDVNEAWSYMMHPDDRQRLTVYWNKVFTGGKGFKHEVRLKNKEGIYRWFYSVGEPVLDADEKVSKWVGSLTDIHEQKLKEERKDEFISIASHELKTPLTTAKAYLQMLELYLDDGNEEAALYVKKANQAVNRLNELISELLDVSKISLGKINYTISTFNFNDMVNSTVENIQLISPKHTIVKTGKVYDKVT